VIEADAPFVLILAPVVAIAAFAAARWARRTRLRRAAQWSPGAAQLARREGRWVPAAIAAAMGLGTVGLAGPRWGSEEVTAETRSLSLVLAVDISRSMLARDAAPNRLARALAEARRLVQDLPQDRIGLLAFAGTSYILAPLTVDAGALMLFLDALDPEIASTGGTALGAALAQGSEVLAASGDAGDRVLVVFTDGEAHDSLPAVLEAARALAAGGVRLILVAEGGRRPVTIPVSDETGAEVDVWRDAGGAPVETARRDDVLASVADAAGGTVVAAELADQAGAVRDLLAAFKRVATTRAETQRGVLRAWIPIVFGAVILLAAGWRRHTASLIGVVLAFGLSSAASAQWRGEDAAHRAFTDGSLQEAAERYIAAVRRGGGGDTSWLNAGTLALHLGDTTLAAIALERASGSLDPEVRFRARFNAGWMALTAALRDSAGEHATRAEAAFREALRLKPHDVDSKWNLELAVRLRRASTGGGGGTPPPPPGSGSGAPPPRQQPEAPPEPTALSRRQAEQILSSIAQEELRTRAARAGRFRASTPPRGKDW
jgi:Ca-activated chloride channel family protein